MGGGLLVSVSGEGFSDSVGLHCALGTVAPVQARVLGLEDAECMAVAMPAGPAAVAVGLSAQARSGGGARVEYLGAAQVEAVVPESGPAAGGSPLRLLGRELPSRGARCRVGGGSGEAWGVAEGSVEGSAAGDVVFQYREAAAVRSVAQRAGWVGLGTVFHVAGSNLQASCSVGWESASAAAPAHLVSTALAVCEAAWSEEGPATLRVGGSSEGAGVSFAREAHVAGVAPAVSPEAGGAVLSVAGGEFEDSLRCSL